MIFTSTTRERVTRRVHGDVMGQAFDCCTRPEDPEPWASHPGPHAASRSPHRHNPDWMHFNPRPGYRAPANPILVEFRWYMTTDSGQECGVAYWAWNTLLNLEPGMGSVTHPPGTLPEHIEHARRVLARLAAFS